MTQEDRQDRHNTVHIHPFPHHFHQGMNCCGVADVMDARAPTICAAVNFALHQYIREPTANRACAYRLTNLGYEEQCRWVGYSNDRHPITVSLVLAEYRKQRRT